MSITNLKVTPGQSLLTEDEAISLLGLQDRRNPRSALRWLCRTGKLGYVDIARGIRRYRQEDLQVFIEKHAVQAKD